MSRLPLFPLSTWLYPGIPLRLQVFERRYLDMISTQLKQQAGFGIVPIRKGREVGKPPTIYPLGVEVKITDWHQLPNGVLGITVHGKKKFRVLESEVQPDGLMLGQVNWLGADQPATIGERYRGLADLLQDLKEHPATVTMDLPAAQDASELSYQLSQLLPMEAREKMNALAMTSATERLDFLASRISGLAQS